MSEHVGKTWWNSPWSVAFTTVFFLITCLMARTPPPRRLGWTTTFANGRNDVIDIHTVIVHVKNSCLTSPKNQWDFDHCFCDVSKCLLVLGVVEVERHVTVKSQNNYQQSLSIFPWCFQSHHTFKFRNGFCLEAQQFRWWCSARNGWAQRYRISIIQAFNLWRLTGAFICRSFKIISD